MAAGGGHGAGDGEAGVLSSMLAKEFAGLKKKVEGCWDGGGGGGGGGADVMRPVTDEDGIERIVGAYHAVIGVSAMISVLRHRGDRGARVAEAGAWIQEEFDGRVHPRIVAALDDSVRGQTAHLRGDGREAADRAERYRMLRQTMSALEFVRQYGGVDKAAG